MTLRTIWRYGWRGSLVLILALTMNYTVAWLCAIRSPAEYLGECEGAGCKFCPSDISAIKGKVDTSCWEGVGYYQRYAYVYLTTEGFNPGMAVKNGDEVQYASNVWYAGWPFYSVQSRVILKDSYGYYAEREKWELPWHIILWRGPQTDLLPKFLGAKWERRLPIVPFFPGFVLNMLFYSMVAFLMLNTHHVVNLLVRLKAERWSRENALAIQP